MAARLDGDAAAAILDGGDVADGGEDASAGSDASAGGGLTVLHAFDGESGTVAAYRGKPEMNVAANGSQVAQITNPSLDVYDYSGTMLKTTSLATLVTAAGLNPTTSPGGKPPYEPHILYDPFIQRWIISVSCSLDCVLVSSGSDAVTSSWQGFYLDSYGMDPGVHLGYDKYGVYFSEVQIAALASKDTPYGSIGFAIPNSEMAWTTTLAPTHKNKIVGKPLDLMPVVDDTQSKVMGAPAFFLARTCMGANCQGNPGNLTVNDAFRWIVSYGTWSGTTFNWTSNHTSLCAGGTAPADQCVRTDPNGTSDRWLFNTPIDPPQPGTSVPLRGAEIHRILGAMQQGNHLHAVLGSGPCTSNCGAHGPDTADIFIWADIDCSTPSNCAVSQTQKVSTPDHLLWPTVGVDANGNVGIFANVVNGSATYLGIEAWSHHVTDPPGVLSGPVVVAPGTTAYLCSINPTVSQTGNPAGISTVRDPLDPTALWVTEQYANDSADCHWDTRIVQYRP